MMARTACPQNLLRVIREPAPMRLPLAACRVVIVAWRWPGPCSRQRTYVLPGCPAAGTPRQRPMCQDRRGGSASVQREPGRVEVATTDREITWTLRSRSSGKLEDGGEVRVLS